MNNAHELAPWTPERLKQLDPRRGDELVAHAQAALASVGLSLGMSRFSTLGHRQAPLTAWLVRRRHRNRRRLPPTRKQIICELLAQGLSEREISRRLGYRSHTTVWAVKREMRQAGQVRSAESIRRPVAAAVCNDVPVSSVITEKRDAGPCSGDFL